MKIKSEELSRFKTDVIYKEGYRVVYYYENYHEVPEGLYAKNIEDFINFFKENNNDVQYTDINSLLKMFLKEVPNALGVAIYDVNQNCMGKIIKERLGIPADKYKDKNGKDRIDNFEERVLKPAKAALDESCQIGRASCRERV